MALRRDLAYPDIQEAQVPHDDGAQHTYHADVLNPRGGSLHPPCFSSLPGASRGKVNYRRPRSTLNSRFLWLGRQKDDPKEERIT